MFSTTDNHLPCLLKEEIESGDVAILEVEPSSKNGSPTPAVNGLEPSVVIVSFQSDSFMVEGGKTKWSGSSALGTAETRYTLLLDAVVLPFIKEDMVLISA